MSKLLNESTIRRFMQLAGTPSLAKEFISDQETKAYLFEQDLEEEEPVEEEPVEEEPGLEGGEDLDVDAEEEVDLGGEGGAELGAEEEGEVDVDESDLGCLETAIEILQQIVDAGQDTEDMPGLEPPDQEEEPVDMGAEVAPEGEEAAPVAAAEMPAEEEEEALAESVIRDLLRTSNVNVISESDVTRMTNKVYNKVAKRLIQESLRRR